MSQATVHELKQPPHSAQAEMSVLGGLMIDVSAFDKVAPILAEQDFYIKRNQFIYRAIGFLARRGEPADVVSVSDFLQGRGHKEVADLTYLAMLAKDTPSAANVATYARIVKEKSLLREMYGLFMQFSARALATGESSAQDLLNEAENALFKLNQAAMKGTHDFIRLADALQQQVDNIEKLHDNPPSDGVLGISTGFTALDRQTSGLQGGDLVVIAARPSMGKAQSLDSKILGRDGNWHLMGALKIGQSLASIDGHDSFVTGIFPQGVKQLYRVKFSDGRFADCCAEHLWRVYHRKWKEAKIISTQEIQHYLTRTKESGRFWIDTISGDFGDKQNIPVDPWLLGALLGDGGLTKKSIIFSKTSSEILQRLKQNLPESVELSFQGGCSYSLVNSDNKRSGILDSNPLTKGIRALGLMGKKSHEKYIPDIYKYADKNIRINLLRGLLDTDGWVEKHGTVLISTSSKQLAIDIQYIARSLGFWCSMNEKEPKYSYKGNIYKGMTAYKLTISGEDTSALFLFSEKQIRCINQRERKKHIAFSEITPIHNAECQCISVSHSSNLYITDNFTVTHNTSLVMNMAESAAMNGHAVAVFSMEMSAGQLAQRMLAGNAGLPLRVIREPWTIFDQGWPKLAAGNGRLHPLPMWLNDSAGLRPSDIRALCMRLQAEIRAEIPAGLGLVVVDYLQLMSFDGKPGNRSEGLGDITRALKQLAKEFNVPVLLLSQLNRDVEKRPDKRPHLADLRDSGAIEQDADVVMFVYRDEKYHEESLDKGTAEIIFGKQRNGELGTVRLGFDGWLTRFRNLED